MYKWPGHIIIRLCHGSLEALLAFCGSDPQMPLPEHPVGRTEVGQEPGISSSRLTMESTMNRPRKEKVR